MPCVRQLANCINSDFGKGESIHLEREASGEERKTVLRTVVRWPERWGTGPNVERVGKDR